MWNWSSVVVLSSELPPQQGKDNNRHEVDDGVVHSISGNRHNSWHDENDADEEGPRAAPGVDVEGSLAQVPWAWDEFAKDELAHDWNAVRQIESDGAYVEDSRDGGVGSETDKVDSDAEKYAEPDRGQWCVGDGVDLSPDPGEWQQTVAGKCKDCAGGGL